MPQDPPKRLFLGGGEPIDAEWFKKIKFPCQCGCGSATCNCGSTEVEVEAKFAEEEVPTEWPNPVNRPVRIIDKP